jgi:hypothetical protein
VDDDSPVPAKSRHIIIELQGSVARSPDMNETNGPVQKRKRKEPPNDYSNDKTTPTRYVTYFSVDQFNE